jgi:predicted nucleotidyltransferase
MAIHPAIDKHLDELTALCREYGVERLEAFGSVVTGEFDARSSDLDFLATLLSGRPVDVVIAKALRNPYFARSVDEMRRLVYAA